MRRRITLVLIGLVLAAGAPAGAAVQPGPDCDLWDSFVFAHLLTMTVEDVTACLEAGADPTVRTDNGKSPLHSAASLGRVDVVEVLPAAGANVVARDTFGWTPVFEAVSTGKVEAVEALFAAGADPTARTNSGLTLLHLAVLVDNVAIVETLLDAGADPFAEDSRGETPWDYIQRSEVLRGSGAYLRMSDMHSNGR